MFTPAPFKLFLTINPLLHKLSRAGWLLLLWFVSAGLYPAVAGAADGTVTLQLKWLHGFQFAGYYAALEKGFYRDAGLNVIIREHEEGRSPIEVMLDGDAQYGITGADIVLHRAIGDPVVAMATIFQHSAYAFLVRADSGIEKIEDFAGKRVMLNPGRQDAALHAALRRAGLHAGDYVRLQTSYDIQSLVNKETDVFNAYVTDQGFELREAGVDERYILPKQYGVDFYGDILATTEDEIAKNPERAAAFRAASIRGWRYAMQNPDEIIDLMLEKYDLHGRSRASLEYEANTSRELIQPLLVSIGYMNPDRWQHIRDIFVELELIDSDSSIDGLIYRHTSVSESWARWVIENIYLLIILAGGVFAALLMLMIMHMRRVIRERTAELSESEQYQRALVNAAPACIVNMDRQGHLLSINAAGLNMLEVDDVNNLRDVSILDRVELQYQEDFLQLIDKVFNGERASLLFSVDSFRGNKLWLETHAVPFRDAGGNIESILAVTLDDTQRKAAEEVLRTSEERFRDLTQLLPETVFETDTNLNVTYANEHAFELFGYSRDDFQGEINCLNLLSPQEHPRAKANFGKRMLGNELGAVEYQAMRKDGSVFPVIMHASLIRKDNAITGVRGVLIDVTEFKQNELALRRSQKMDAVGQLTGGIAHDFNNILNIILGNLELLKKDVSTDEKLAGRVKAIEKPARRAADLTRQLLSFSSHHAGKVSSININQLINEMQGLIERSLTPQIELQQRLAEDLWPVRIDAGDFEDSLLNLVLNARDAITGHGKVVIETANRTLDSDFCDHQPDIEPGEYVELLIGDSGAGMTQEQLEHIFEPFYTTKEHGKGTGLGLAMVFGFLQRSSGHVIVETEVQSGSTFHVYLPRDIVAADEQEMLEDTGQHVTVSGGNETILVVEDEEGLLELAKESLQQLGYRVLTATHGQQALQVMAEHSEIAVLFTDVLMPGGMNGYELAEKAVQLYPGLKVLIASGYTDPAAVLGVEQPVQAIYLTKPYRQSELAAKINELISTAQS